ncbi:MAG: prolyl oligopeptidase family serine peptidase [Burkholderiales bacterium]|nr:prolyl oligopeptidase family serine peptidase [Burkholderiales bacterium]
MKPIVPASVAAALALASPFAMAQTPDTTPTFHPPATPARPVTDVVHDMTLTDPYRWLEDNKSDEVVKWTRAQHDAALGWLATNTPEVPGLRDELTRYIDRTITSPPAFYKGREFFTRKMKGDAQAKLYTRLDGKEVLLFDPMKIDPSGKSALSGRAYSRDARIVAVGVQRAGDELPTQYFIDSKSGEPVYAPLPQVWSVSWTKDNAVAYVQPRTQEQVSRQLPLYTQRVDLRKPIAGQPVVQKFTDAKQWGGVSDYEYSPYTVYATGEGKRAQFAIAKTGSSEAPRVIFAEKDANASIEMIGDTLYAWTNAGAPNGRLLKGSVAKPEFKDWREIVPEQKDVVLESFVVTKKHIIVREKRELLERLRVLDLDGKPVRELAAPEFGSVSSLSYDRDSNTLYAALATFTAPFKLYKLDADRLEWKFLYQDESVLDTSNIETKMVYVTSRDGTRVPMFVSAKKGIKLDGNNPTLLYGYGGFNIGINVGYLGAFATLINRGVVVAQPGLRGGDEFGERWHEGGMLGNKQNVFDDFYASAEWLISQGYTQSKRLVAFGGSNGGLLVGAAATQRPDLFHGIVCSVPLLDMVRYHKFRIARYWIPEYGDPDRAADFAWLLRYSPYHNVREGVNMPTMLVIAGENDTRVDPLHAKKFVARAQNNPGQVSPILLKMDYDSGHGSGKSTAQQVEDRETWLKFILALSGANDGKP